MVKRIENDEATLLRFGSAVVARRNPATGRLEMGRGFQLLLPIHKLYSRALLRTAAARLQRQRNQLGK